MSATLPILEDIRTRLLAKVERFEVDLFPEDPEKYRLNAEDGAILVQYVGSTFKEVGSTSIVQQQRIVNVVLTVLARSQHDESGALNVLDQTRLAVVGFKPSNCTSISLLKEEFLGEESGIWQFQLWLKTETYQVEQDEPKDLVKFKEALYRNKTMQKV